MIILIMEDLDHQSLSRLGWCLGQFEILPTLEKDLVRRHAQPKISINQKSKKFAALVDSMLF